MIRRPPRSTRVRSSAASDVYKRQGAGGQRPVIVDPAERMAPFVRTEAGERIGDKTVAERFRRHALDGLAHDGLIGGGLDRDGLVHGGLVRNGLDYGGGNGAGPRGQ